MLRRPDNSGKICPRRLMGAICMSAGIVVILAKVIYFMATNITVPFDGRGQFLVGTGAALLGLTSADPILMGIANKNGKEIK